MSELSFKLSKPIQVSKDGGFEDVYELVLTAPSMKDRKQAAKLVQFIARAKKHQEKELFSLIGLDGIEKLKEQGEEFVEVDDSQVKTGLRDIITSSEEDLELFYEAFQTLLLRVGTVLDGIGIKQSHIDTLDLSDFEELCFDYCENFIK